MFLPYFSIAYWWKQLPRECPISPVLIVLNIRFPIRMSTIIKQPIRTSGNWRQTRAAS